MYITGVYINDCILAWKDEYFYKDTTNRIELLPDSYQIFLRHHLGHYFQEERRYGNADAQCYE